MYFLEQLAAEWYAYNGYFVRTNVKFGKRLTGGYEGEIDVAAYDPKTRELIHLETLAGAESRTETEQRFVKKFQAAEKHYNSVFPFQITAVKQYALVGSSKTAKPRAFGKNIQVIRIPEFMKIITKQLKMYSPTAVAVPETYPLLRAIQFCVHYG